MCDRIDLPTNDQRAALGEMVQFAFCEIRVIAEDHGTQAADLADAFHNIPREIHGWGTWRPAYTQEERVAVT